MLANRLASTLIYCIHRCSCHTISINSNNCWRKPSCECLRESLLEANVYDPDDSVEGNIDDLHPFQYTWYCDQLDLTFMYDAIIYPDVGGNIKHTLMIPSSFLRNGATYSFMVTVHSISYKSPKNKRILMNTFIISLVLHV